MANASERIPSLAPGSNAEQERIAPVVLVTGASRGLGRGIAVAAAGLGCSVVINYAGNSAAAEEAVRLCGARRVWPEQRFIALQADIGKRDERVRLVEETLSQLGRIDALISNAGMAPRQRADITQMTEESFEELIRVNLQGPHFLTQAVVNYWLGQHPVPLLPAGFTVVFVGSISATRASLNRGEYCISKAGLAMARELWALRVAGEGIQVFELRPGIMATDMTSAVKEKYDKMMAEGVVPQRRWGTAEDVGLAVVAILEGRFPYSAGTVIDLDGGLHLQTL